MPFVARSWKDVASGVPAVTPLMWAALRNDLDAARQILAGPGPHHLDARDPRGFTALSVAAMMCHWRVAQELLNAGADVRIKDADGKSAIHRIDECRRGGVDKDCKNTRRAIKEDDDAREGQGPAPTAHHRPNDHALRADSRPPEWRSNPQHPARPGRRSR